MAIAPIDCAGSLSKTGCQLNPPSDDVQTPPVAAPAKYTFGLPGMPTTALTRFPGGPMKRYCRCANGDSGSAFLASVGEAAGTGCDPACDSGPAPGLFLFWRAFAEGFCCVSAKLASKNVVIRKAVNRPIQRTSFVANLHLAVGMGAGRNQRTAMVTWRIAECRLCAGLNSARRAKGTRGS